MATNVNLDENTELETATGLQENSNHPQPQVELETLQDTRKHSNHPEPPVEMETSIDTLKHSTNQPQPVVNIEASSDPREPSIQSQSQSVRPKKRNNRKHSRKENSEDILRTKEGANTISKAPKSTKRKEKYSALNHFFQSTEEDRRSRNCVPANVQRDNIPANVQRDYEPTVPHTTNTPSTRYALPRSEFVPYTTNTSSTRYALPRSEFDNLHFNQTLQSPMDLRSRGVQWNNVYEVQRSMNLVPARVNVENPAQHAPLGSSIMGHPNYSNIHLAQTYPPTRDFDMRARYNNVEHEVERTYTNDSQPFLGILHAKMDPDKRPECAFCKRNNAEDYHHLLKDDLGGVVCPILSSFTCKMCAATGRNAHTHKYCPVNPVTKGDPVAAGMPPGRPLTKDDKMWLKYFHGRLILELFLEQNPGASKFVKRF